MNDNLKLEKELVSKLTPDQQIIYLARRIGFKSLPPSISEILDSDYFLGDQLNVYPYWRERLLELFPNPLFTSHSYLVVGGAIGCISGDTKILVNGVNIISIRDLYNKFINKEFKVTSYNKGKFLSDKCIKIWNNGIKPTYKLYINDNNPLIVTSEHRFLTSFGYKSLIDLEIGDNLIGNKDSLIVTKIKDNEPIEVFDLTIENYHNYAVMINPEDYVITHNSGKSTFSQIVAYYDLLKFCWHPDVCKFLGLSRSISPFTIRCLSTSIEKAVNTVTSKLNNLVYNSPYFQELMRGKKGLPLNIKILPAKRSKDIISEILITAILSEINEFTPDRAKDIIDAVISRQYSRLKRGKGIFYHTILDSSDKSEDSPSNRFLLEAGYQDEVKQINAAIWDTKPLDYSDKKFKVYTGDSSKSPFIIPDGYNFKNNDLDPDKILDVPEDLRPLYQANIIKSLQETAGISTGINNKFFINKDKVIESLCLPKLTDEIIKVDFYDESQIWDIVGKEILSVIPKDKKVYARVDLGVVHDLAGIAIGCGDEIGYEIDPKNKKRKTFLGKYLVPISFSIGRFDDQETSIDKIIKFFIKLSEYYNIGCISTDNFQSTAIRQMLEFVKIPKRYISVDKTDGPYVTMKNLILSGRLKLCNNGLLLTELLNLLRISPKKIDHPSTMKYISTDVKFIEDAVMNSDGVIRGSKDCADAVCGCVYSMIQDGENVFSEVKQAKHNSYLDLYKKVADWNKSKLIEFSNLM